MFSALLFQVVVKDLAVVKAELLREGRRREDPDCSGVIGRNRGAGSGGDENGGDRVHAGVTARVGVAAEKQEVADRDSCLLQRFPARSLFQRLAVIDEAPRKRPAVRLVLSFDKKNTGRHFDDYIDGGKRVPILPDSCATLGTGREFGHSAFP